MTALLVNKWYINFSWDTFNVSRFSLENIGALRVNGMQGKLEYWLGNNQYIVNLCCITDTLVIVSHIISLHTQYKK